MGTAVTTTSKIKQVFKFQTDNIDFVGAIVENDHGQTSIEGRVIFPNGEKVLFFSPVDEEDALQLRLNGASKTIAAFYGTAVVHEKFDNGYEGEASAEKPSGARSMLH